MNRTQNRRDFIKTLLTGAAAAAASRELSGQSPPEAVASRWVGIQIGPHSLYDVYRAVLKAFEAGASGVLASREYDEMRLPGLRAFGRAVRESGASA